MAKAQLRQERIDGSDLDARSATDIAQVRSSDMVLPVRRQQRERGEVPKYLRLRLGTREPLQ